MKVLTIARDDERSAGGSDHGRAIRQGSRPSAIAPSHWPFGVDLQAAAHFFGHVGGFERTSRPSRGPGGRGPQPSGRNSGSMTSGHEQHGDEGDTAHQFDEDDGREPDARRQPRDRPPSASSTPSGSEKTMPTSAVSSETNTPPQSRVSTTWSPSQSEPRNRRKARIGKTTKEEQRRADRAPRRARPQQPGDQHGADCLRKVYAPASPLRIGAIAEVVQLLAMMPSRSVPMRGACRRSMTPCRPSPRRSAAGSAR